MGAAALALARKGTMEPSLNAISALAIVTY